MKSENIAAPATVPTGLPPAARYAQATARRRKDSREASHHKCPGNPSQKFVDFQSHYFKRTDI